MGRFNRQICLLCIFCLLFSNINISRADGADEAYSADEILGICAEVVSWASSDGAFFSENLVATAGSSASDWLFIGYCRLPSESVDEEGIDEYLQALEKYITDLYASGNLENTKATEWQRVGLAALAAGADPTDFGVDLDGNSVDLVADGAYDHARYSSLGRQGVNGWCFALILLDACETEIPEGAAYTREYIIEEILSAQLGNGGFSLNSVADPDVTSIAVQALSKYYGDDTVYTFENGEETVSRTVGEAIDLALSWLALAQLEDGDFSSYGTANVESTAQVLLALSCLGIDAQTDERFIKGENTVIDGLLKYRTESGGFAHALDDDGNATVENGLSSAQALCGLTAYYRQLLGMPGFYEFKDAQSDTDIETELDITEEIEETETEEEMDEIEEAKQTEAENDTDSQEYSETQETASETDDEELETISETEDDNGGLPSYFVYIISVIIICIGIIAFIVMKKIGVEDDKSPSE